MDDLELIFNKYYKYVKGYALSLCFDESLAEEITQEAFYKALKNADKFKGQCRTETWLCTIARNEFISHKRKKKTENIDDYSFLVSDESASQSVEDKEQIKQILQSAIQLPTPYKEVFYMKAMGELPFSVIAEVYGKTESWARVTYHRARQKIIERMSDYE